MAKTNNTSLSAQGGSIDLSSQNHRNRTPGTIDSFWHQSAEGIQSNRWNKQFPYQFAYVNEKRDSAGGGSSYSLEISQGGEGDTSPFKSKTKSIFTLPIPPESLTISTQFAINTNVTLGGIIEEHNGAPIKMIQISGTTGVLPLKDSTGGLINEFGSKNAVFGGIVANATSVLGIFKGPANVERDPDGDVLSTSGYAQFRLLQEFLETYAFRKKLGDPALRLALCIWKDEAVYLVTPMSFELRRSADSPWEYKYSISLKAWKRIQLETQPGFGDETGQVVLKRDGMSSILKAVKDASKVLNGAKGLLSSVVTDAKRAIFEPLRLVTLFTKDILGVGLSVADLPSSFVGAAKSAIVDFAATRNGFQNFAKDFNGKTAETLEIFKQLEAFAGVLGKTESISGTTGLIGALSALSAQRRPRSAGKKSTANGNPGSDYFKGINGSGNPAADVLDNPDNYPEVFDSIPVGQLNASPGMVRQVADERLRVRQLTRLDFENMRDSFISVSNDYADSVGLSNATYNSIYNRTSKKVNREVTDSDYDVLFSLNNVVSALDALSASGNVERFKIDSVQFIAGLARRSGIAFTEPVSKFLVPFPYGATLENLATRYLVDPDRWIEIATLNGLREPYIDEEGFELPFLTIGNIDTLNIADCSNLYINQPVSIQSTTQPRSFRRIKKIEKISESNCVITLDGDPNLNLYSPANQAVLQAYLPDTVNSQMSIYIPSSVDANQVDLQLKSIPGVDDFDPLFRVGGADLLVDQKGDLVVTPDGDIRLAVGLTNIVQKAKVRIAIKRGSLNRHPTVGLPIEVGENTADVSITELLEATQGLFEDDPTFTGVSAVSLDKTGGGLFLSARIGVAGVNQEIPITVEIR